MDKEQMNITQMLEELTDTVCDTLCKYADTFDESCLCECIRENGQCPLDKYI